MLNAIYLGHVQIEPNEKPPPKCGVYSGSLFVEELKPRVSSFEAHHALVYGKAKVEIAVDFLPLYPVFDGNKYAPQATEPQPPIVEKDHYALSNEQNAFVESLWVCKSCRNPLRRIRCDYSDALGNLLKKTELQCLKCKKTPECIPLCGFVTQMDLCSLQIGTYINDSIIEAYFKLIVDRNKKLSNQVPKVTYFSTQFFTHLMNYNGYEKVKREGGRRVDLFKEFDKILVPINEKDYHWMLAVVNLRDCRLEFYDSLGSCGGKYMDALLLYLKYRNYEGSKEGKTTIQWLDMPKDKILYTPENKIPQQTGNDCGMFLCKYANCIAQDIPLTKPFPFCADNMEYFRKRMVLELCNGAIL